MFLQQRYLALVAGGSGGWGPGQDSQTTQMGVKFLYIPLLNSLDSHLLSTPFEADVFFGLGTLVSFPFIRSIQTAGWLGWGPWAQETCPGARCSRWRVGAAALRGPVAADRRLKGLRLGLGREGALTVHRQKRAPCRASVEASPPSGRPGPGQLGQ